MSVVQTKEMTENGFLSHLFGWTNSYCFGPIDMNPRS